MNSNIKSMNEMMEQYIAYRVRWQSFTQLPIPFQIILISSDRWVRTWFN